MGATARHLTAFGREILGKGRVRKIEDLCEKTGSKKDSGHAG